jgi:hypothetical protein
MHFSANKRFSFNLIYISLNKLDVRGGGGGGGGSFTKSVVCNSGGLGYSPTEKFCIFPPLGMYFVRFLNQMFGYTALHYTVDKLNF